MEQMSWLTKLTRNALLAMRGGGVGAIAKVIAIRLYSNDRSLGLKRDLKEDFETPPALPDFYCIQEA